TAGLPGESAQWEAVTSHSLTPETPIRLRYESGGLAFDREISLDQDYMFTIADRVTNNSAAPASLRPFAVVRQYDLPPDWAPFYILHEGAVGVLDDRLKLEKYRNMQKGESLSAGSLGGWLGLTTKYWMAAVIPDQAETVNAAAAASRDGVQTIYRVSYEGIDKTLAPGATLEYTGRIFAGAKRVEVLNRYKDEYGLPRFEDAVDWGNFWFFTKPFFWALNLFNSWFGNFGLAILALTVVVKLAFFPLQNKAYASMAKMRKLMPEMEKIRERFAADKQRQQKEILELYQREKANPLAGCLPLIPQMFVFYGLYKTLFVTLEMRHEPFFGWIRDLSAPDPAMVFNLFGLLPYDPSAIPLLGAILGIGVWPVLYGVTMWALQSLSPPPPDPTQRMMMQFFPLVFTFIFAGFAAGLVVYWTWSNILSIAQQYYIMRLNGVDTQFDKLLARLRGKPAAEDA
ncbi:MAG: membrane protein insertase YidC, partial [Pseudomonadota bacterium]